MNENIDPNRLKEDIDKLKKIHIQMIALLSKAKDIVCHYGIVNERARAYWIGHISTALSNDSDYCGKSMTTLEDTIKELEEIKERINEGIE